ncbi:MAG: alkyl sulfatase dimerization domain-containing protein [Acidimicrobiales bacterium]
MSLHPKPRDGDRVATADPVELSDRVIDTGAADEPTNRVTNRLSEIDDDIAIVESFSHMIALRTDAGIVSFDASGHGSGVAVMEALRGWSTDPLDSLIYTHGHADHVGGSGAVMADADDRGHRRPRVLGHENVPRRMQRYDDTNGWNVAINMRQFGGVSPRHGMGLVTEQRFIPPDVVRPDTTYRDHLRLSVGGLDIDLHHGKGETDDHTWAWIPKHRAICTGDLVIWVFPNAGNPQKVQRYPLEWAQELRRMIAHEPELILPAHGLPIRGRERIELVLGDMASVLEGLVRDTVALMNADVPLETIVHEVRVDPDLLDRPWLRPVYDEPEFVVRNIWRMYGGWWNGDPSLLKPAPPAAVAAEIAALAGGPEPLVVRARALAEAGDFRLACQLIEIAAGAAPDDRSVHGARAEIYLARRQAEHSLMAKGIYAAAGRASQAIVDEG